MRSGRQYLMSGESENAGEDYGELVRELLSEPSEQYTLGRVIEVAVQTVPGCEFAGISVRRGRGVIQTPAWVGEQVPALDGAQYELDEGPCLDAIRVQDTVVIDDTRTDSRWPRWGPQAADLGAFSVLSVRLSTPKDVVGGLNLYSSRRSAFDEDAVQVAHRYAVHASTAVAVTEQMEGLRTAMQTRHQIGVAQGMLMLRYGLDEDQAFQFLARVSQQSNVRLRDVATRVADELTKNGWPGEH
jgi:transcriptional regulator with GAF, ATPase, and Fis domain